MEPDVQRIRPALTPSGRATVLAPTLALLTDFGDRDWYVAAMKAVALSIEPTLPIVDVTHRVAPGDVRAGGFILSQCWQDFPAGTVFVGVVDPGVGTERPAIALEAEGRIFVGPDNGLFGWLGNDATACHALTNAALFRERVTHTFHGRDIFAPVGARLASGQATLDQVGPDHGSIQPSKWPEPEFGKTAARGHILYIDHYGNAITNLTQAELERRYCVEQAIVSLHPRRLPLLKTFGEAPAGKTLAYFGSGGLLELAVNGGSAAKVLDLRLDQRVEFEEDA